MAVVEVEFFHDVICSFCFPMSYRMRKLAEEMDDVNIIHRSFALVKNVTDFDYMFGSRENAKQEIMTHWDHANQNDDLHRFNIQGMLEEDFLFPSSMNGLIACKAAYFIGGDALYWDLFDALQKKLFMENKNVEDITIIEKAVEETNIDLELWRKYFNDSKTKESVEADFKLAVSYGIQSVPTLIVDRKYKVSGAQPLDKIKAIISEIRLQKELSSVEENGTCSLVDGKMQCD